MTDRYLYKGHHRQNRLGNFSLGLGALVAVFLTTKLGTTMQHAEVAKTSMKPDSTGAMRTDNVEALAANALEYVAEQTGRSVLVAGSIAAIALIGAFAFAKRSHNRTVREEKNAAHAERALAAATHKAAQQERAALVWRLTVKTETAIARCRATPKEAYFADGALEIEGTRPTDFAEMSVLELVNLAQTNHALPLREESFYNIDSGDQTPPMSRTLYYSLARLKEYRDQTVAHDTGYHPPVSVEQRGVHDLMPELLATTPAPTADPYLTGAYPFVTQPA